MKRLILAALVVALAIALAAPVAVASAPNPKPPRWSQGEKMYHNNYVTVRSGLEFSEGYAVALANDAGRQGLIFKELLISRGDDLRVRIKAKGNATRNARLWFLLDKQRIGAKQNFRPGLHWYVFQIPDGVHGVHRVTLHTKNLGKDEPTGNAPLIVDLVWTWDGD
jgi:hypothetical protein